MVLSSGSGGGVRRGSGRHLLGDDHELPPSAEEFLRLSEFAVVAERKPDLARSAGGERRAAGLDAR